MRKFSLDSKQRNLSKTFAYPLLLYRGATCRVQIWLRNIRLRAWQPGYPDTSRVEESKPTKKVKRQLQAYLCRFDIP